MLDTLGEYLDTLVMNDSYPLFRTQQTVYCLKPKLQFPFVNACVLHYHTNEVTIGALFTKLFSKSCEIKRLFSIAARALFCIVCKMHNCANIPNCQATLLAS